jgi:signal transduction histidine kinase
MMSKVQTRILVVDDSEAGRYVKAHVLRKQRYKVLEAEDGRTALQQCEKAAPDLVLLDVRLPDRNGVELCREIKANFPGIVVLQTSAATTTARDRAAALKGGADGFLVEPIEPEELLASVQALLRMRGAELALRRMNEGLEDLVAERTQALAEAHRQLEIESLERRKAEEVLWHTQKLEVIGQLTGGIAHDFNNLLAVIVASVEMVRNALQAEEDVPRDRLLRILTTAETATDRAAKLTRQLLAFARRGALRAETVTLDELIVATEPFLRRALGETVTLNLYYAPNLWPSHIDPVQFEAAMLNLIVNARDAIANGGEVQIETSNVTLETDAANKARMAAGDYVCVRVSDTGRGMEPDVAARVFEPFFTTKPVGKGTGLGLSQVYGFVKQSGGHITLETQPGCGTTFRLYLPRCSGVQPIADPAAHPGEPEPKGTETVLVVEDNFEVLELAVATISDLGYRVLSAPNGSAALDILGREDQVDLLFSDVVLPGSINGFDLVRQARDLRHGLKALVTSGYANVQRPGTDRPDVPLLPKPYRRAELAQRIRFALDHP